MRKILLLLMLSVWAFSARAELVIEITQGAEGALPIAVVPFGWSGTGAGAPQYNIGEIIAADLARSGRFKPLPAGQMLAQPHRGTDVDFRDWRTLRQENLVVGELSPNGVGGYLARFQLFDVYRGEQIAGYNIATTARDLRSAAHHIADIIYETLTGERGAFSTRIAYVIAKPAAGGKERLELHVADADGFNPQTIVSSDEPIMSPSWTSDGRKLAYVSFERREPSVWVQEVLTGRREKVSSFKGINGAPSWSPDGRYLALTLSKGGNPDIYVMDLLNRQLRPLTQHWAIDTEPSWSPDGKHIVFTSDRGGSPQIYRVASSGGTPERLTFDGGYNARASYSPDGKSLTMVTRSNGKYQIGVLDLKTRSLQVVSDGSLDESPSFAPNGGMIIYATSAKGRGVLAAVSIDGRVKQRLGLQAGDVREPVWSPFTQR